MKTNLSPAEQNTLNMADAVYGALSKPRVSPATNRKNHRDFTDSELATILHGLRIIQTEGRCEGCAAGMCDHFDEAEPLTNDQIDDLCERLNLA